MTEGSKKQLRTLYDKYKLTADDVFTNPTQGWVIVTRSGIDKIQAAADIKISYELVVVDVPGKTYVIKAKGNLGDQSIETYGEVSPANTSNKYPIAIAEKRAMSRVVLKLAGFYAAGAFGQDEADDFNVKKSERGSIKDLIKETL